MLSTTLSTLSIISFDFNNLIKNVEVLFYFAIAKTEI
jgi:hypothetical protein